MVVAGIGCCWMIGRVGVGVVGVGVRINLEVLCWVVLLVEVGGIMPRY